MNSTTDTHAVVIKDDGLECPKCHGRDVREWDRSERWNRIEYSGGTVVIHQGQADFETLGLVCADCSTELDAPDDFWADVLWT